MRIALRHRMIHALAVAVLAACLATPQQLAAQDATPSKTVAASASGKTKVPPGSGAEPRHAESKDAGLLFPVTITAYDVATRRELFYRRHIAPTIAGNSVGDWTVLQGVQEQLGTWIGPYVDAVKISTTISEAFPIGNQAATRRLDELVQDCARVLGLRKPDIFIRNSPFTVAYVSEIDSRPLLTLTSGLLSLYEDRPAELRFIVGRELGRIKCGHAGQRMKAYAVFAALHNVNLAVVPDEYQLALPTLALGRLMSAFREMEFSADRAGLLCCQDLDVAFQAMLRQLHGLKADSTWIDPHSPDFDPESYFKTIHYWEGRPLVKFIQEVKGYTAESPFVPERIAQLVMWAGSGSYREILGRTATSSGPDPDQIVTFRSITIYNVANSNDVNPYVVAYSGDKRLFVTTVVDQQSSVQWTGIDQTRALLDSQPVFFEIWSSDWGSDSFLGGFVIYPKNLGRGHGHPQILQSPIDWDWKERVTTSRQGFAKVSLEYSTRTKVKK